MSEPVRVVRSEEDLPFFNSNRHARPPGVVIVAQTNDGVLEQVTRLGAFSRYRRVYEVDVVAHRIDLPVRFPSVGDVYFFEGRVQASWQVHDPVAAVRNQLSDVSSRVGARISGVARQVARAFKIEQSVEAERAVNEELRKTPLVFDEGFKIVDCFVQISIDGEARTFLKQRESAHRNAELGSYRRQGDIIDADHKGKLEGIRLKHEVEQQEVRLQAVRRAFTGDNDLLYMHLANNPNDTGHLIEMINNRDHVAQQDRRAVLQDLLDRGFIQDSDVGSLRDAVLGDTSNAITRGPADNPFSSRSITTGTTSSSESEAAEKRSPETVDGPPPAESSGSTNKPSAPSGGANVSGWKPLRKRT